MGSWVKSSSASQPAGCPSQGPTGLLVVARTPQVWKLLGRKCLLSQGSFGLRHISSKPLPGCCGKNLLGDDGDVMMGWGVGKDDEDGWWWVRHGSTLIRLDRRRLGHATPRSLDQRSADRSRSDPVPPPRQYPCHYAGPEGGSRCLPRVARPADLVLGAKDAHATAPPPGPTRSGLGVFWVLGTPVATPTGGKGDLGKDD